jgi:hypothetical protein
MRLYDLEKGSKILVDLSDGSSYAIFDHLDGMYSYCTTEKGGVIHLSGGTPLKKSGDHYLIDGTSA